LATPLVVVGEGSFAEACFTSLSRAQLRRENAPEPRLVAPGEVRGLVGRTHVEGVETRDGRIAARLVALAGPPAPAHELAAMAGAELGWDGHGFPVERDPSGRVQRMKGTHAPELWAAGDVCGYMGSEAASRDGARVAANIVAEHGGTKEGA
jgi:thioredoxin reductase